MVISVLWRTCKSCMLSPPAVAIWMRATWVSSALTDDVGFRAQIQQTSSTHQHSNDRRWRCTSLTQASHTLSPFPHAFLVQALPWLPLRPMEQWHKTMIKRKHHFIIWEVWKMRRQRRLAHQKQSNDHMVVAWIKSGSNIIAATWKPRSMQPTRE